MDRARLAEYAKTRRLTLVRSKADVAERGGLSHVTVAKIEDGFAVRELQLVKLDDGLDWARGSAARVLAGGDPDPLDTPDAISRWMPSPPPPEGYADHRLQYIWQSPGINQEVLLETIRLIVSRWERDGTSYDPRGLHGESWCDDRPASA